MNCDPLMKGRSGLGSEVEGVSMSMLRSVYLGREGNEDWKLIVDL